MLGQSQQPCEGKLGPTIQHCIFCWLDAEYTHAHIYVTFTLLDVTTLDLKFAFVLLGLLAQSPQVDFSHSYM